jgi:GMP synthase (glutamine-hydrolysing)
MELIRQAADVGMPVLGICLGSQLIAAALGAQVYAGPRKEIGWYPVETVDKSDPLTRRLPSTLMAFHWHGDTFDLPADAVRLFRSKLYQNQGFRWGNHVYGMQFHLEVTAAMIEEWLADPGCAAELRAAPDTKAEVIRSQTAQYAKPMESFSLELFSRFLEVSEARAGASRSRTGSAPPADSGDRLELARGKRLGGGRD